MKFNAVVSLVTTTPMDVSVALPFEVEGKDAYAAARMAAFKVARRLYPNLGEPSFVRERKDGSFQAAIGVYRFDTGYGVTKGVTIVIRLSPA